MSVPLESFTHWSLASRQSLYYSSERSRRLFRRQLRKLPHPRRRSSHNALPPSPTRRQATAAKARSSLISSVSPAGSSSSASGTPQQILTPPDPPNRAGPTASVGSHPLPPMPLPPTITSCKAVFSNISWEGKHPFQISGADLKLTLYRFLKQCLTHKRPGYYSPATFTPTGPSPTYSLVRSSQHADSSSYYEPELVTP